jgi:hypothetical protein
LPQDSLMSIQNARCCAVLALLAAPSVASAGGNTGPGTYASWTNLAAGGGFLDDNDPAQGFGTYSSSVTDASATLNWAEFSSTFTGSASGGNQIRSISRGIALFSFTESMNFAMTWSMAAAVAEGNQVGWTLVSLDSGLDIYAVSYDDLVVNTAGGAAAQANGSLSGTIAAGNYLLAMAADCSSAGGAFSYGATFTAVPAPGALALAALAGWQRRRRS